jgi:hypothetical protein
MSKTIETAAAGGMRVALLAMLATAVGVLVSPITPAADAQTAAAARPGNTAGVDAGALPVGQLNAVSANSAADVWAVGQASTPYGTPPEANLAEHWNGRKWSRVAVPYPRPPNPSTQVTGALNGVAVISAADAWAVGDSLVGAQLAHWNGQAWAQVKVPSLPVYGIDYDLNAVAATSAANVWAVGSVGNASLILHWNGKAWTHAATPKSGDAALYLYGVTALS